MDHGERTLLLGHLRRQREHVLTTVEGLAEADLRRPVLPSGWSCLSMVSHLTFDDEIFWFGAVVAGDRLVIESMDDQDAWQVDPKRPAAKILADYRSAIRRSDAIADATTLDTAPAWWPDDQFGHWRMASLREVILHVTVETATHAGHLDAAAELIDGRQFMVLE